MRSFRRPILTCSLLAIYAGISLLGQGLHWLMPEDGHHHDFLVICYATHDHAPAGQSLSATDCVADAHVCEICAFLLQAISQPPQAAPPSVSQPLVAALPTPVEHIYSSVSLGLHAPRGPPQLLA